MIIIVAVFMPQNKVLANKRILINSFVAFINYRIVYGYLLSA